MYRLRKFLNHSTLHFLLHLEFLYLTVLNYIKERKCPKKERVLIKSTIRCLMHKKNPLMIFLLALLPLPKHYLCGILCVLCAYMVKPRHMLSLFVALSICGIQWYRDLTIMSMLPLQVIACVLCNNYGSGIKH